MESMEKREQIIELIKEDSWYNIPVENTTDKIFSILCVIQQRELLIAYEKHHYTPSEWALASKQCEKEIDDFLATNCG